MKMKEPSDIKSETGKQRSNKPHNFRKKSGGRKKGKRQQSTAVDFFRRVGFSVHRDGPGLYLKTIESLGLFVSMQFKNGSNVKKCLMQEKVVKPKIPDLADEHTAHKKQIWDFHMTMKTEHKLEGNLRNLFAVLMSLCDSVTKNQVEASPEYKTLEMTLDSMGLLSVIKRLIYTRDTNNLNVRLNKALALMMLYQENFKTYKTSGIITQQ